MNKYRKKTASKCDGAAAGDPTNRQARKKKSLKGPFSRPGELKLGVVSKLGGVCVCVCVLQWHMRSLVTEV